jgi:hypothetical protein
MKNIMELRRTRKSQFIGHLSHTLIVNAHLIIIILKSRMLDYDVKGLA